MKKKLGLSTFQIGATARPIDRLALLTVTVVLLVIGIWHFTYPGPADPKSISFQGWKRGIYPLNPDEALETMVGDHVDPQKYPLVVGKTQEELVKKFGYVTTLDSTVSYNRFCYDHSYYRGLPVIFLRKSNWMVVMNNGKAAEIVSMKGC